MRVVIRVDASIRIGTGHVMRCLTLADELRNNGGAVEFVCRSFPGNQCQLIRRRGYRVHALADSSGGEVVAGNGAPFYAKWLGVDWRQDVRDVLAVLNKEISIDWLIVDHYAIDSEWLHALRAYVDKIFVIDDLADRNLECDLLLDQTYGRCEREYQSLVSSPCKLLLGARFALLRPQFAQKRLEALGRRSRFQEVGRLLVCMGGMDADNITEVVLRGLEGVSWATPIEIDVILGGGAPSLNRSKNFARFSSLSINVYTNVKNIEDFMAKADLAIGGGGTTSWERCSLGLPSIVVSLAENQDRIVSELESANAVVSLGSSKMISEKKILREVERFVHKPSLLKTISAAAEVICDGKGCHRVMKFLS